MLYEVITELDFGGYIIDTPGIKGFGMLDMDKYEIGHYFPEIFKRLEKCQYNNCTHTHEPGCEVKNRITSYNVCYTKLLRAIRFWKKLTIR